MLIPPGAEKALPSSDCEEQAAHIGPSSVPSHILILISILMFKLASLRTSLAKDHMRGKTIGTGGMLALCARYPPPILRRRRVWAAGILVIFGVVLTFAFYRMYTHDGKVLGQVLSDAVVYGGFAFCGFVLLVAMLLFASEIGYNNALKLPAIQKAFEPTYCEWCRYPLGGKLVCPQCGRQITTGRRKEV